MIYRVYSSVTFTFLIFEININYRTPKNYCQIKWFLELVFISIDGLTKLVADAVEIIVTY